MKMTTRLPSNIIIIGMPGSGKTTVGRHLSKLTGKKWIDTDKLLQDRLGCRIQTFFETHGEAAFREAEQSVLLYLLTLSNCVISTGGGIVCQPVNHSLLRSIGKVVFIDVPLDSLWSRLQGDSKRPLLQTADPLGTLTHLYQSRYAMYQHCAHTVIPITQPSSNKVAQTILNHLCDA